MDELLEKLAELEHEQWSHWVQYMTNNWNYIALTKWLGQSVTPYKGLSEGEKDSDRAWALRVLDIIEQHHSSKETAK